MIKRKQLLKGKNKTNIKKLETHKDMNNKIVNKVNVKSLMLKRIQFFQNPFCLTLNLTIEF